MLSEQHILWNFTIAHVHRLKVYLYVSVKDEAMLRYIRDRTAAPYFSNLVWFIGNHILNLDTCVRNDTE